MSGWAELERDVEPTACPLWEKRWKGKERSDWKKGSQTASEERGRASSDRKEGQN
jgi:hypothetical protein